MNDRKAFRDEDELSIASDDIFIEVPTPKSEEATLSWRNDPYYKYVLLCIGFFQSCVYCLLASIVSHQITSHHITSYHIENQNSI